MRLTLFIILLSISFTSCNNPRYDLNIDNTVSVFGDVAWTSVLTDENVLFVFISPDCPLCQNYAKALRELHQEYGKEVSFVGLVSGELYSTLEIKEFMRIYELGFPVFLDESYRISKSFEASITPEVVFFDSKNEEVIYQGAIDNWAISLGKKRTVVTEKYLADAIENHIADREINPKKTKAIGCFIE